MKNNKVATEKKSALKTEKISRKEAIKKSSKYAAFTAAGMLLVLSPKKAQASSPSSPPDW